MFVTEYVASRMVPVYVCNLGRWTVHLQPAPPCVSYDACVAQAPRLEGADLKPRGQSTLLHCI